MSRFLQSNLCRVVKMRSMIIAAAAWLVVMWCASSMALATTESCSEPTTIKDQPGTLRAVLDNGFEIVVISEPDSMTTDRSAQAWLVVRSGSLYETDEQRGAAKVLEAIVRQGTLNFADEQINEILIDDPEWGAAFSGSFVSFDHAAYVASIDLKDQDGFSQTLGFFRSMLDGQSLVLTEKRIAEAIEQVKVQIADEQNPELRARQQWLPRLMVGTPFGDRMPSVDTLSLATLNPKHVRAFASETYRSAQATLIVAGDFEPQAMIDRLGKELSVLHDDRQPLIVDGRCKIDPSGRAVMGVDSDLEESQSALIWFRDRDIAGSSAEGTEPWSKRADDYKQDTIRSTVIERVAGEVIRYRLGRLLRRELGHDIDMSVDQVDLWGQVDLLQIVVADDDISWRKGLGAIIHECNRLLDFGVSDEEVKRARRALLSRWHRDAQEWNTLKLDSRMGLYHWLITTGRPVIDMTLWDQHATAMMSLITDQEIEDTISTLIDPRLASYVAIVPRPVEHHVASNPKVLDAIVHRSAQEFLAAPINSIDPEWFEWSYGSLLDSSPASNNDADATIKAITQHPASGVWKATLSNGVKLWAMQAPAKTSSRDQSDDQSDDQNQEPQRIYCSATISGEVIDELVGNETILRAAIVAWDAPATEQRSQDSVNAFINEYAINIRATLGVGYAQLQIDAPLNASTQAIELLYALLDRPMVEQDAFNDWQAQANQQTAEPLDTGLREFYCQDQSPKLASEISLDDAQRTLARICRFGDIDIAIIGPGDGASLIEEASPYFGTLTRSSLQPTKPFIDQRDQPHASPSIDPECIQRSLRLLANQDQDEGIIIGFLADDTDQLEQTRALVLASMVFDELLHTQAKHMEFEGSIRSQIAFTDLLDGRSVLVIRAGCSSDQTAEANGLIESAIETVLINGISESQLQTVREKVLSSVDVFFEYPQFWSQRLSVLTASDLEIEDLWSMRHGYESITLSQTNAMLNKLFLSNDRFTIELVEEE